jgi:hypothetical protein
MCETQRDDDVVAFLDFGRNRFERVIIRASESRGSGQVKRNRTSGREQVFGRHDRSPRESALTARATEVGRNRIRARA